MTPLSPVTQPDALAASSPHVVDSRRLFGPNLYSARCGAVLEVSAEPTDLFASRIAAWRTHAAAMVRALEWGEPDLHVRLQSGGATLFLAAPPDVLLTATEVNEQAWAGAESRDARAAPDTAIEALLAMAHVERQAHSQLGAVVAEAAARGVSATFDGEWLTIGSGTGSLTWATGAVPAPGDVVWSVVHDVPVALVTGSNGKTTTTRLLAAMWRSAGVVPGWCCSDGVFAGDVKLDDGDFSGPAGARTVLRQTNIGAVVLETARGGILRRGLATSRADAAIVTNVSADHFGEYGISTLAELAEVKAVVARALGAGPLVLNAADPLLIDLSERHGGAVVWFSALNDVAVMDAHVDAGGDAAVLRNGRAMLHRAGEWHDLGNVREMPLTLSGTAPHNIENLLGAALLASVLGIPVHAIRSTMAVFGATVADNPGRLQVHRYGAMTVLVDYAHNPDGLAALCQTARATPRQRTVLLLGQAGNRDDAEIRALARSAMAVLSFDLVIVKEELALLRGREPGDVPRVLADELLRLGVPSDRIELVPSELDGVKRAFAWAEDGDLLVCPIHAEKVEVLAWLTRLTSSGWRAGDLLPD